MKKNILVTGGLGFIGSNFISKIIKMNYNIVNVDCKSYASVDPDILKFNLFDNYKFYEININNYDDINNIIKKYSFEKIIHFAAESHVDNSIEDSLIFAKTNILGTINILESYKNLESNKKLFLHVSTDEVFGSIETDRFSEISSYKPNSPYAASKASSDHFVRAYFETHNLPVIITNCTNNYGKYQHKEKFIPTIIKSLISSFKIPVYGNGKNIREWISVEDHVDALIFLINNGNIGESYCIGSGDELSNIELANKLCFIYDKITNKKNSNSLISYIKDRKGHDFRYAVDSSKINKLGWKNKYNFNDSLENTLLWYLDNKDFLI
tara:strand:+ start:1483 stop:2457 length:975 start_codon:yes stop_codon:yes gene_type:complete